jgi:hypothetical protein
MPIQVGDAVQFHAHRGKVCCINTFSNQACVRFEDGDCLCVPLQSLVRVANTTATCTPECTNKCNAMVS